MPNNSDTSNYQDLQFNDDCIEVVKKGVISQSILGFQRVINYEHNQSKKRSKSMLEA